MNLLVLLLVSVVSSGCALAGSKSKSERVKSCTEQAVSQIEENWAGVSSDVTGTVLLSELKAIMKKLCASAGDRGYLTSSGSLREGKAIQLITEDSAVMTPFCISGALSDPQLVKELEREQLEAFGRNFCRVVLSDPKYMQKAIDVGRRTASNEGVSSAFELLASGKWLDVNAVFRDHPELLVPFLVNEGMKYYESDFSAAQKRAFPRSAYRRYLTRVNGEAVRRGIIEFRGGEIHIDRKAFDRLADQVLSQTR